MVRFVPLQPSPIENRPSIESVTIVLTKGTSTETPLEEIKYTVHYYRSKVLKIWTVGPMIMVMAVVQSYQIRLVFDKIFTKTRKELKLIKEDGLW